MIKGGNIRHKPGTQGIEMNVPDEFEEIAVFLANAPDDDMLQNTGDVQAGSSWHAEKDSKQILNLNN
jgi:hypothetical protein